MFSGFNVNGNKNKNTKTDLEMNGIIRNGIIRTWLSPCLINLIEFIKKVIDENRTVNVFKCTLVRHLG